MFRRFSTNFAVLALLIDLVLVDLAWAAAVYLRLPASALEFVIDVPVVIFPESLFFCFPLLWVGVLVLFSVYDGRKNFKIAEEFTSLTLASFLATICLAGVLYLTFREVSRFLFLMGIGFTFFLQIGWRAVIRLTLWRQGWQSGKRRLLILGSSQPAQQLIREIFLSPRLNISLVGYLGVPQAVNGYTSDLYLGSVEDARQVILERQVDDVVLALPLRDQELLSRVVNQLHDLPVGVWMIPDYFSLTLYGARVEDFLGIPMLDLRAPALREDQRMFKRAFDLIVTILLLPCFLPVMGVLALAVVLDSPGPVFYHSRRVGENGKIFFMKKFRTMVVGADRMTDQLIQQSQPGQVVHKRPDDPRVTRVGRFLRRVSLDELPQLFNVLKGEMSLVGPRPELPELVMKYDLWQRKRFAVPQGMTGWWQVNGRSDRPMHLHTEDDLYYVQHYSIWLDIQILLRTFWVVFRRKGAY